MKWQFIGPKIILNTDNGFVIKLISGGWANPEDYEVSLPPQCTSEQRESLVKEGFNEALSKLLAFS